MTENGTVKETHTSDVSVEGNGRLRLIQALETDYAPGQEISIVFTDSEGNALSAATFAIAFF